MAVMKVGAAGIETISGAMKRPKKVNGHNHGNYLVMTHRTAPTQNPNCQGIYTFDSDHYERTGTPSANELAARARFSAVRQMVADRAEDLQHIASDNAAFLAQKDLANGKKTMRAYLWAVCGAEYDSQHSNG